jgi:hypothetical protein
LRRKEIRTSAFATASDPHFERMCQVANTPEEWLLFMKLPDYAVWKKQKKLDVIQLPLPDLDENQQQATFSS